MGERLNEILVEASLPPLDTATLRNFEAYLQLLLRWNSQINLTAIRDEEGILERHFVESIACAVALPEGIRTLLDFGSGGGLPGIPIALCKQEIAVTLAESQGKKAAFLREAARVLPVPFRVHAGRGESLHERFDCVTLRAVDRMHDAVGTAGVLVRPGGWLVLMTSRTEVSKLKMATEEDYAWQDEALLPGSDQRVLAMAKRV